MSTVAIVVVAYPLLLVLVVVAVVAAVRATTAPIVADSTHYPGLARLRRLTGLTRVTGVLIALVVCGLLAQAGRLGQGILLIPAVFALVQVLATLVGELATRGAARSAGAAALETRRLRDYLPLSLTWQTAGGGALLVALLAWTTAVASPDDMGRAGRSLDHACAHSCDSGALSPWPGSFYSAPVGLALGAMVALAMVTVVVAVRRPRNGADPQVLQIDELVRRSSVRGVVGSGAVAIGGTLAGLGLAVAMRLARGPGDILPLDLRIAGWVALVLAVAGLLLAARGVVAMLGTRAEAAAPMTPVAP